MQGQAGSYASVLIAGGLRQQDHDRQRQVLFCATDRADGTLPEDQITEQEEGMLGKKSCNAR